MWPTKKQAMASAETHACDDYPKGVKYFAEGKTDGMVDFCYDGGVAVEQTRMAYHGA